MFVIIYVYSMIITNMCIISPSQAPGRILSCQLTSVKSTSIHQRGSSSGTYKKKGSTLQFSPSVTLPFCKIGRNWREVAFSKPRNCPVEPFLQSNGALLILHPPEGAFEEFFQEQNDFLVSPPLEIQAVGN